MPPSPTTDYVLSDCRIVLPDRVVAHGWVAVADGRIAEIGEGRAPERGIDAWRRPAAAGPGRAAHRPSRDAHSGRARRCAGTPLSAVLAYDAQIAASGITTVFDSLRVGTDSDNAEDRDALIETAATLTEAGRKGLLRAEHRTHLRCEICSPDVLEAVEAFSAASRSTSCR